ncbi:MAG: anthranilate phosphoribosyltransferase [Thermoanaerobacteraceae bacterium]
MIKKALNKIIEKHDLEESEAYDLMIEIMDKSISLSLIGGVLIGLRLKGETIEEITGFAKAMRDKAVKLSLNIPYVIDTCGTGGDGSDTFNVSTAVAIIVAAGGVKVAKHGNRAVSSQSGSADVLSSLGFNIDMEPEKTKKLIEEKGMGFLFAPRYHTAMKNVANVRKELGIRTVFNLLGPLTNPAFIKGHVLGVYDRKLTHTMAEVLINLGIEKGMVVNGYDGLDEITVTGPTLVCEIKDGKIIEYILDPLDYGIQYSDLEDLKGRGPEENSKIILDILKGEKGPKRDIVVLNSAAALYVGKAVESIKDGIKMADNLIDSGLAFSKFNEILEYQRRLN